MTATTATTALTAITATAPTGIRVLFDAVDTLLKETQQERESFFLKYVAPGLSAALLTTGEKCVDLLDQEHILRQLSKGQQEVLGEVLTRKLNSLAKNKGGLLKERHIKALAKETRSWAKFLLS